MLNANEVFDISRTTEYTQAGKKGDLAAFSDVFRYKVLEMFGGWWFDADVLCIKDANEFSQLQHNRMVAGWQDNATVNGAVLYFSDQSLVNQLNNDVANFGFDFSWGAIGPELITSFVRLHNLQSEMQVTNIFYPVALSEFDLILRPDCAPECFARTQNAFTVHLWNEILRRYKIPKNMMPPKGSFLHSRFVQAVPELGKELCLSVASLDTLMSKRDNRISQRFKRLREKIKLLFGAGRKSDAELPN